MSTTARLRRIWLDVHLWIGVGLAILIVPISISGAALVWHDDLDRLIAPARYAVTGAEIAQTPGTYLAKAAEAVPGQTPAILRWPEHEGFPLTVSARGAPAAAGDRPRSTTVFLDPPTGRVLGTSDFGSSFVGIMHLLHGNLMVPQFSGRQIVGWVGLGMLILSLTGLWLWWPRNGAFRTALRWRRSLDQFSNLHHLLGFWIAIPLAVVSATGAFISFPNQARPLMSLAAPVSAQGQRPAFNAPLLRSPALDAGTALGLAQALQPGATPVSLAAPTQQAGVWRVQLRDAVDALTSIEVNDETGAAASIPDRRLAGDRASQWMRWIHEGSHSPFIWAFLVFLTGILPPVFAVTGIVMWLRHRRAHKKIAGLRNRGRELQTAP